MDCGLRRDRGEKELPRGRTFRDLYIDILHFYSSKVEFLPTAVPNQDRVATALHLFWQIRTQP